MGGFDGRHTHLSVQDEVQVVSLGADQAGNRARPLPDDRCCWHRKPFEAVFLPLALICLASAQPSTLPDIASITRLVRRRLVQPAAGWPLPLVSVSLLIFAAAAHQLRTGVARASWEPSGFCDGLGLHSGGLGVDGGAQTECF